MTAIWMEPASPAKSARATANPLPDTEASITVGGLE
jgi:hypothetical protein